ncbi:unnamed protein product [Heligmosomoides polygyrus]|uniref:Reverse transcriptase domain-containing protein n=1 Tax=Heligmosomoides polygyrus TaxID=6339 RepID=A0A3P8G2T4_HELPZ|nr:unnamed protein product [Heligmosomoides polygyrus]
MPFREIFPWTLLYADDVMLASEDKGELEREVQAWCDRLEMFWLRLNVKKTEYLTTDWLSLTGVLYDKKMSERFLKSKIYRTVFRPVAMYGAECWSATKETESRRSVMETKMLRWTAGVTRLNHIRNAAIRQKFGFAPIADKMREARLRWCGHVVRGNEDSDESSYLRAKWSQFDLFMLLMHVLSCALHGYELFSILVPSLGLVYRPWFGVIRSPRPFIMVRFIRSLVRFKLPRNRIKQIIKCVFSPPS